MSDSESRELSDALRDLGERDRQILQLRYGLGDERPHSLREIGRRFGISGERVRQLEARALRSLVEGGPTKRGEGTPVRGGARAAPLRSVQVPRFTRNALRAWTLLLLREGPAHGYELMKRLPALAFTRPGPRLYRLLHELEEDGLLRSRWGDGGHGPDRRVYSLTKSGVRQLEDDAEALGHVSETLEVFLQQYAETSRVRRRGKPRARPARA